MPGGDSGPGLAAPGVCDGWLGGVKLAIGPRRPVIPQAELQPPGGRLSSVVGGDRPWGGRSLVQFLCLRPGRRVPPVAGDQGL